MALHGRLTTQQLVERIERGEITQVLAVIPDYYGRLVGKRIHGEFFAEHILADGMHACDYLLTVDMEMDPIPGYALSSWETGYGDFHAVPDFDTLRIATWLPETAIVICDLEGEPSHKPVSVAPRTILRRQLERLEQAGFTAKAGSELEFYLFNDPYDTARAKRYEDLTRAGWYIEDYHILQGTREDDVIGGIRHHLHQSGVPVETSKGEWGPGQQEINIQFADALEMADRHMIYKHVAKEVAWAHGKSITFMAKWHPDEAGSSCHIHLSLWDARDGSPVFADGNGYAPIFRHFVGGMLEHAREITLFLGSTVNSYKRYQPDTFAPTAICWGGDNRTVPFRVVGKGKSLRIECRIPGADVNPYLAYAALLAAGLDGIERQVEPGEMYVGNAYVDETLEHIPSSLPEAIDEAADSAFLREALGDDVIEHILHFARTEQRKFEKSVTDWERIRYFERI
ncbi:MAG: glutamine synthetase family protein [Candidatus Poribacteria bacterium]|nr:glutamine synthetase family protein [Candidatus Poribacteria bacterium]